MGKLWLFGLDWIGFIFTKSNWIWTRFGYVGMDMDWIRIQNFHIRTPLVATAIALPNDNTSEYFSVFFSLGLAPNASLTSTFSRLVYVM